MLSQWGFSWEAGVGFFGGGGGGGADANSLLH